MIVSNVALLLAYALCLGPLKRYRRFLQVQWCRVNCTLSGLSVRVSGSAASDGSVLYVCNHCSYLDIPVIGWFADATFVAKAEVANWPLFGHAARLTRTVFVQRVGAAAKAQSEQLCRRLADGENLTLFAEGTSTDGSGVAPFKSTLFAIAERVPKDAPLRVQPVSITYTRLKDGTPLVGERRALYCWFGDASMMPHLWRVLTLKGAEVELRFLPSFPAAECSDRKQLARRVEAAVAESVAEVNRRLLAGQVAEPELGHGAST